MSGRLQTCVLSREIQRHNHSSENEHHAVLKWRRKVVLLFPQCCKSPTQCINAVTHLLVTRTQQISATALSAARPTQRANGQSHEHLTLERSPRWAAAGAREWPEPKRIVSLHLFVLRPSVRTCRDQKGSAVLRCRALPEPREEPFGTHYLLARWLAVARGLWRVMLEIHAEQCRTARALTPLFGSALRPTAPPLKSGAVKPSGTAAKTHICTVTSTRSHDSVTSTKG